MIKNYHKIVFRNIKKKCLLHTFNILGFSIGIAVCLAVANFIITEYSFDHFHKKLDNIYNVFYHIQAPTGEGKNGRTSSGIGPAMLRELPGVVNFTRLVKSEVTIVAKESGFKENNVFWADSTFLDIFSFPLIQGDIKSTLKNPYTLVISETTARKYFGDEDALGKIIKVYDPSESLPRNDFEIVGVFKDIPYNSQLQFDVLLSYQTLIGIDPVYKEDHDGTFLYTYVELKNNTDIEALKSKMQDLTDKYEPNADPTRKYSYRLLPYSDYHRTPAMMYMLNSIFDKEQAFIMSLLALIVLVVVWMNYINLSNVISMERAKEIGIRKLMGAEKYDLTLYFIFETFIVNLISALVAVLIVILLKDHINNILDTGGTFYIFTLPWFWGCFILFIALSALLSGFYPAFVLTSYKPIAVLKGKFTGSKKGVVVRSALIVSQFAVAIALGIGTIVIHKQIVYEESAKKYIDFEKVIAIESPQIAYENLFEKYKNFKDDILKLPAIESVSTCNYLPGEFPNSRVRIQTISDKEGYTGAWNLFIGSNFCETFKVDILAGNILFDYNGDQYKGKAVLNRQAATKLGYATPEDAIGKLVFIEGDTCNVIGVVEGYYQLRNMKAEAISLPILFRSGNEVFRWICFRFKGNSISEVNSLVQKKFNDFFPVTPYRYEVLTDYYNLQYKTQTKFLSVFNLLAILSVLLGLMGVIGLISYILAQKSKQIGLRKVFGANIMQIIIVLYKELGRLVLIAILIAWPAIYYFMKRWLQDFPDRIEQNVLWYLLISIFVLFLVIISVLYQVLKVSLLNPVEVLREE
ncbi:MAG: ABC transporter permease [Bacteroidales bacterium]|nr:MAG: ABC transporter permease [Bacteroidales bacterium]